MKSNDAYEVAAFLIGCFVIAVCAAGCGTLALAVFLIFRHP